MNLVPFLLALVMAGLLVTAAVHRHDRPVADRLSWWALTFGVMALIGYMAGSWQEYLAMLIAAGAALVATMLLIIVAIGPDMRRDLGWEYRAWRHDRRFLHAHRAASRRARRADRRIVAAHRAPVDPSHPPTARTS